jgi:hypothetical protein
VTLDEQYTPPPLPKDNTLFDISVPDMLRVALLATQIPPPLPEPEIVLPIIRDCSRVKGTFEETNIPPPSPAAPKTLSPTSHLCISLIVKVEKYTPPPLPSPKIRFRVVIVYFIAKVM